jgi:hypothetical protein
MGNPAKIFSPVFPLITLTRQDTVKIYNSVSEMENIRLSDWIYQTEFQYAYDSKGNKWHFQYNDPPIKNNFWNELRNPSYKSVLIWNKISKYQMEDLKEEFYRLLKKDNDTLTEVVDAKFLKLILENCVSFTELCSALDKYVFNANETVLWREQERFSLNEM